jgi:hypothetical protein
MTLAPMNEAISVKSSEKKDFVCQGKKIDLLDGDVT